MQEENGRQLTRPEDLNVPAHIRAVLRLEGAAICVAAIAAYALTGGSWLLFAVLILVPDLSMIGYLRNERVGAIVYNSAHTYTLPLILVGIGFAAGIAAFTAIGLIWIAHIGGDRVLGYGLKHFTGFKHTHLGAGQV